MQYWDSYTFSNPLQYSKQWAPSILITTAHTSFQLREEAWQCLPTPDVLPSAFTTVLRKCMTTTLLRTKRMKVNSPSWHLSWPKDNSHEKTNSNIKNKGGGADNKKKRFLNTEQIRIHMQSKNPLNLEHCLVTVSENTGRIGKVAQIMWETSATGMENFSTFL